MPDAVANATPKFWFTYDGRKYGGRFLTIGEQTQCHVDIERLTNGHYGEWVSSNVPNLQFVARSTEVAVWLSKMIVAWPGDVKPINFLELDDPDTMFGMWEACSEEANSFRQARHPGRGSQGVGGETSAPAVVPHVLQAPA